MKLLNATNWFSWLFQWQPSPHCRSTNDIPRCLEALHRRLHSCLGNLILHWHGYDCGRHQATPYRIQHRDSSPHHALRHRHWDLGHRACRREFRRSSSGDWRPSRLSCWHPVVRELLWSPGKGQIGQGRHDWSPWVLFHLLWLFCHGRTSSYWR